MLTVTMPYRCTMSLQGFMPFGVAGLALDKQKLVGKLSRRISDATADIQFGIKAKSNDIKLSRATVIAYEKGDAVIPLDEYKKCLDEFTAGDAEIEKQLEELVTISITTEEAKVAKEVIGRVDFGKMERKQFSAPDMANLYEAEEIITTALDAAKEE